MFRQKLMRQCAQAAFHAVSDNGIADFAGRGQAEANGRLRVPAQILLAAGSMRARLQDQPLPHLFQAFGGGQKITPRAQGQKLRRPANIRRAMPRLCRHDKKSGRQAFATACAPTRQHQTPAFGSHTGAKSMAAFTHQIAWLESPFHVTHSFAEPNRKNARLGHFKWPI